MKLKLLVSSLLLSTLPTLTQAAVHNTCGTVGGGVNYPQTHNSNAQNKLTVHTFSELEAALQSGIKNIFIPGNVTIKLPYHRDALVIPDNISLFSDRGVNGSKGALLHVDYIDEQAYYFPIIKTANNVHISGLRLQGPVYMINTKVLTQGIQTQKYSTGLVVENSELSGWGGGAIAIKKAQKVKVHHNFIHHNQKSERGYGVVVQNGDASTAIYCNVFDNNRHSIAGSGQQGESYTASNNIVLASGKGHAFDMHEDAFNVGDGGQSINIINNWFVFGGTQWGHYPAVKLRGVPRDGLAKITGNVFRSKLLYKTASGKKRRALEGVPGSMSDDRTLRSLNSFNIDMHLRKTKTQCFLDYKNNSVPVLCAAVKSYLAKNK